MGADGLQTRRLFGERMSARSWLAVASVTRAGSRPARGDNPAP